MERETGECFLLECEVNMSAKQNEEKKNEKKNKENANDRQNKKKEIDALSYMPPHSLQRFYGHILFTIIF